MVDIKEAVKTSLRLSNDAFDEEIETLISASKIDLAQADIKVDKANDDTIPIIRQAIIIYCRLHFGEPSDYDRLKMAYDEIKHQLSMNSEFTDFREA